MAITFNKLKSPLLDMQDKIVLGKLTGCRVCDVIQDHHEYLTWASTQGLFKFTKMVTETIQEQALHKARKVHYAEEIAPYIQEQADPYRVELDFDDIPF